MGCLNNMSINPDPKTILVVDDEMDMRFFLTTLLETSGYKVIAAKNGTEGIASAAAHRPDLILLDLMMPRQGGLLMYRQLKQSPELMQIAVVMLSSVDRKSFGYSLQMLNVQSTEPLPPPEAYLEKPPDPDRVLHTIRQFI